MEQTLGKRIMQHRKRLGLTQDALAEKLGITAQAVSKWEHDLSCPDITMLPKLAEIFGITTDDLLGHRSAPVYQAEVVTEEENDDDRKSGTNWSVHWDAGRKSSITFAVFVLLSGVLYLTSKVCDWGVSFWSILWPCFLLVHGISGLFPKFKVFPFAMALFGGYSLLDNLEIMQMPIGKELLFPVCVVLFGISLLMDGLKKPIKSQFRVLHNGSDSKKVREHCITESNRFACDVAFSTLTHHVSSELLEGGEAEVSFGTLTVDLQDCDQVAANCHIEADCSFGELYLLIPKRFRVDQDADASFGAINVEGQPDEDAIGSISLDASASFGNITIRYI